jgi:gliding motility-associated-like protein
VNPITPTFTQVNPICNGAVLDPLTPTSNNNITGTWSPAINNTETTTYTFTPDTTQPNQACAVSQTMTIKVNSLIIPTFTQVAAICNGAILETLTPISNNNITGTWAPAVMNNTETTTYTFTPDTTQPSGQACAVNETMTIIVNPLITPTFSQVAAICNGAVLDPLPLASDNGITGTWAPGIDNTATTLYTFTPDALETCAVNETMTIIVNPITPAFTQVDPICNGAVLDPLTPTSNNNITGTWSPAINNTETTTYTFTPDTTQPDQACAINETMTITVNTLITPTFTQVDPICNGAILDPLTPTSNNNITGTWSPAINNTETTTYTFTPDTTQPGQACAVNQKMEITVNPLVTPTFTQVAAIGNGDVLAALPTASNNGVTGTWSPAAINNTLTTTYTFTPDTSETCADLFTLEIVVNNIVNSINSIEVQVNLVSSFDGNQSIEVIASGGTAPYEYRLENEPWQDSSFFNYITDGFYAVFVREKTAYNNQPATSLQVINYPVFFTPNNDGFNDIWNIKGLEVQSKAQITIYDRYGKIITIYKPTSPGWDGLYNGKKMPSNDYWFTIEYLDIENIPKVFRSHFSLIR